MNLAAEQAKRTQRAWEGLHSQQIKIEPLSDHDWRVTNGDQAPYFVRLIDPDHWTCTCDDFVARGHLGLRCKHIEAMRLQSTPCALNGQKGVHMTELKLTLAEQLKVLTGWLVPEWAVKKDKKVAHGKPFVWHEYTRIMLDKVFGAEAWSLSGDKVHALNLPNNDQLAYAPVRLQVRFADGACVTRSDIGVGLVQAKVESPDLADQKSDVFETGYKSAVTDGLKGCAADLGRIFRPMQDGAMIAAVTNGRFAAAFPFPDGVITADVQRSHLMTIVPAWATKTDSAIAGGKPFVPHEYVTQALDTIFGPQHWSFLIGAVSVETLPNGEMLVYVPGTLQVTFADGTQAARFDVGLTPIRRKKDASDLTATPAESYETAFKAAVTDALKGCAGDLGCCFRPLLSEDVEAALLTGYFDNEFKRLRPVAPDALEQGKRALGRDNGDLVTASQSLPAKSIMLFGDGTPVKTTDPIERDAFERFTLAHNAAPASVNALRAWACIYGDGKPVTEDARARHVFTDYVAAHSGVAPASADTLRTWHKQHQPA